jgi:hypothetical protein
VYYRITIQQDNLPEGAEVQIAGLGAFENGQSYNVSEEEHDRFRSQHSHQQDVIDPVTDRVLSAEVVPGPPLEECQIYGVTVEKFADAEVPVVNEPAEVAAVHVEDENGGAGA